MKDKDKDKDQDKDKNDEWLDAMELATERDMAVLRKRLESIQVVRALRLGASLPPPAQAETPSAAVVVATSSLQAAVLACLPEGLENGMVRSQVTFAVDKSGFKFNGKDLYQNVSATLQRLSSKGLIGGKLVDGKTRFYKLPGPKKESV